MVKIGFRLAIPKRVIICAASSSLSSSALKLPLPFYIIKLGFLFIFTATDNQFDQSTDDAHFLQAVDSVIVQCN